MSNLETKYGLPSEVIFCKRCIMTNQRPIAIQEYKHTKESKKDTMPFDEEGICDGCRIAEFKETTIDWREREKELITLCDKYRKDDGSYDCVIPGSGGKDSFYTAHLLKYKYGMHPLTVTWAPNMYTDWGWKNMQHWIHSGFDNILFTPNGRVHRLLTRLAVENLFHPFQPFMIGQKSLAPSIAILHKIPLIFYGECESSIADNQKPEKDTKLFAAYNTTEVTLGGVSSTDLVEKYDLHENDLKAYYPVNLKEFEKSKIVTRHLGYYMKWYPQDHYYYAVKHGNFEPAPERSSGTYSKYSSIDDKIDDLHYYTNYIKFGLGRAMYDASWEIREGKITREEGINLSKRYSGEFPERFINEIFEYLTITEKEFPQAYKMFKHPEMDHDYFMSLADKFRSQHLWKKEDGKWKLRHVLWESAKKEK